jgi:thiaminase/transcriptional activator TenA
MSFAPELREAATSIWSAVHAHPFVRGIGDGTLTRDRYAFYLRQDYLHLIDFARVLAAASAKSPDLETMTRFSALAHWTLTEEMALHRRTCASFGIGEAELARTEPSAVTAAYASMLARTASEGDLGDIVAALLPCAAGYVEIALALRERGMPGAPAYRDWIETYTSQPMRETAAWLVRLADEHSAGAAGGARERRHGLYRMSARFELSFFDAAWKMSMGPEPMPPEEKRA